MSIVKNIAGKLRSRLEEAGVDIQETNLSEIAGDMLRMDAAGLPVSVDDVVRAARPVRELGLLQPSRRAIERIILADGEPTFPPAG